MLPRPGSTRGDSRRLDGTTAWLERDDRQRLIATSPLLSLTYKITWFGFETLPHRHLFTVTYLLSVAYVYNAEERSPI